RPRAARGQPTYGAILPDDDHDGRRRSWDPLGRDDRTEGAFGWSVEHLAGSLARPPAIGRVGLHDGDVVAGEPKRLSMNPGEAELEDVHRRLREEREDPRRRARRKRRREPAHSSRSTAIAHAPSAAAPSVRSAVTSSEPCSSDAACQRPTSPRTVSTRTSAKHALVA